MLKPGAAHDFEFLADRALELRATGKIYAIVSVMTESYEIESLQFVPALIYHICKIMDYNTGIATFHWQGEQA